MDMKISMTYNSETNCPESSISFNLFSKKTVRNCKGKSLVAFPNDYCVIDIETTGLSATYDDIIEISALKISSNNIVDSFSSLIQPDSLTKNFVDDYITELTGITNEMLSSAPSEEYVLPLFKEFIGNSTLVAHNAHFDINFLYDSFMNRFDLPLSNDFVDTMRIAKRILKNLPHYRLSDIAAYYDIDYSSAHRALSDCQITYNCYQKLKDDFFTQYSTIQEFEKQISAGLRSKDIHATALSFDESNPLYGKVVVFTGTLEKMTRREAMQIVANLGGTNGDNVTAKTNYLVLGNNDYCKSIKDGKSNKQKRAEQLKLKGNDIEILPESVFYDMIFDVHS